jgi:protein-tyrosine phosphatase
MIAKLSENIYLSGANEVNDIDSLMRHGITAVLNVAYEVSDPHHKDFLMIKIGLREFHPNPDFFKAMAINTLANLIENGHTVLIHCYAGAHRSPYIAFRYLAEKQNRPIEEVYKEIMPNVPWGIINPPNIP